MSYARFSEGDVYVFSHSAYEPPKNIVCQVCSLDDERGRDVAEMLDHLNEHRAAGHVVPRRAFDRLQMELAARTAEAVRCLETTSNASTYTTETDTKTLP